jgi:rhodanese-related sulfurtransferase
MSWLSRLFSPSDSPVTPADFARRDPEVPVLDVRTPGEFSGGHVDGAHNVDFMDRSFADGVRALADQGAIRKDAPVYLYCRSGNRSGKATQALRDMGYEGAVNVGGFEALRAAGAKTA